MSLIARGGIEAEIGIQETLNQVRRSIRWASVLHGLAMLVSLIAVVFWASLAEDYWMEPAITGRVAGLVLLGLLLIAAIVSFLAMRLIHPPTDAGIALLLERRLPILGDRLITAIELGRGVNHSFSRAMVEQTRREASSILAQAGDLQLIHHGRIARAWLFACLAALSIFLFTFFKPAVTETWAKRVLLLSAVRYPRQTHLVLVGFDHGVRKVARGRDVEIVIEAEGVTPEKVIVHHRIPGGRVGKGHATKVGAHRFVMTIPRVLEEMEIEAAGGDDRTEPGRLVVVAPPRLIAVKADVRFPPYTNLSPKTIDFVGNAISILNGTEVQLSILANKSVEYLRASVGSKEIAVQRTAENAFRAAFKIHDRISLEVTLRDGDGVELSEPFVIDFVGERDQPPRVEAVLDRIGAAITNKARVPVKMNITDDFGVISLAFGYSINGGEAGQTPIPPQSSDPRRFKGAPAFEVGALKLSSGSKLSLWASATDNDQQTGPNQGKSEPIGLEIVTPEELLSRMAAREINLRQRFEQVIRELQLSRSVLTGLQSTSAKPSLTEPSWREEVARILADVRKNEEETMGVALEFRAILDELVNNRVGNAGLLARIESGILHPLEEIKAAEFAAVHDRLAKLRGASPSKSGPLITDAESALDHLIASCEQVLKNMMKLEDFQEIVSMLRSVIAEQKSILEKTRSERKKQIRELLK